jgi:hypothetical protein
MDTTFALLEKINELRATLDGINFTAYFNPQDIDEVTGYSEIIANATAIKALGDQLILEKTTA